MQAYDSILSGYLCIPWDEYMLNGKSFVRI